MEFYFTLIRSLKKLNIGNSFLGAFHRRLIPFIGAQWNSCF